ncbi:MAG: hypothetical protein IJP29_00380 [Lachnospiraceae bacterium]|nr:hypothetical protein [Lachnospiraceae bacterium]
MGMVFDNDISGQILSHELLQIMKMQILADRLQRLCGLGLLFLILAIGNYIYAFHNEFNENAIKKILLCTIFGMVFFGAVLVKAVPLLVQDAQVRIGTVCDKDSDYRRQSRFCYLIFEDGEKLNVPDRMYDHTEIGDNFYTVYCGNELIEVLNMEDYQLPVE